VTAAGDPRIAAVSAQAPMMDGLAASMAVMRHAGPGPVLRVTAHGVWDALRGALGLSPHTLPIVGPPGSLAAMSTPDAEAGVASIATETFRNQVAARIFLGMGIYRPVRSARDVRCPLLLQICEGDVVVPVEPSEEVARLAPRSEVIQYPSGHFAVYLGADFERAVADQLAFFRRHLLGAESAREARSEPEAASANGR
jgi:pimeloyl-ACP methyl ester carboxylesterase